MARKSALRIAFLFALAPATIFPKCADAAPSRLQPFFDLSHLAADLSLELTKANERSPASEPPTQTACRYEVMLQASTLWGALDALPSVMAMRTFVTASQNTRAADAVEKLAARKLRGEVQSVRDRTNELRGLCAAYPEIVAMSRKIVVLTTRANVALDAEWP